MITRPGRSPDVAKEKVFDRQLINVASVTVLGTIMSILDTTIVNVALNSLVRSFHTSLASIQWVSTGYLLALATVVPLTRWVVDRFGTKRAWMTSLVLFTLGSILCGLAWSASSLIVFRVIQGLGGGMIMPIGQTIIAREAGPDRLGRVMTVIGVPQLLGPMIGPVIGGLILSSLSWRFIFFVNVPIGIIALVRAHRILPADVSASASAHPLDVLGMALLSPGMALLLYGISEFGNAGRLTAHVYLGLGLGLALVGSFVIHATRAAQPLLDLRLWKNRGFAMSTTTGFLFAMGMNAAMFLVPLYYQLARGDSPLRAALLMAPGGIGAMIAMPNAGKVMDRAGARRIVPLGLTIFSFSVLPYTMLSAHSNEAVLAFLWFLRGVGAGSTMTPTMAAGYSSLRKAQISGATTINNMANRLGASLGIALAAVVLQRRIASSVPGVGTGGLSELTSRARLHDAQALAHSFGFVFWITVGVGALAIIPALRLPAKRERTEHLSDDNAETTNPGVEVLSLD